MGRSQERVRITDEWRSADLEQQWREKLNRTDAHAPMMLIHRVREIESALQREKAITNGHRGEREDFNERRNRETEKWRTQL